MLAFLVALALVPAVALLVAHERQQRATWREFRAVLEGCLANAEGRLAARDARVRELEDALYAKHAAVLELPNLHREPPAPAEQPLPAAIRQFVDGFVDPDARDEYEAEARRLLRARPDASSADLIAALSTAG